MSNYTIQDIFQKYGEEYVKNNKLSPEQWKVYNSIIKCKTYALGYHTITCKDCGETITGFNSCRNRHCPMCQFYSREKWIDNECNNLLDCPYFHIVTTVPSQLNELFLYNKRELYNILFKAHSESILELAEDPKWLGAKVGITSILHTWGQTLELHPHIHSIVTGGGIKNNKWIEVDKDYLFKVQVLSSLFKGKFLSMLKSIDLNLPKHLSHLKDYRALNKFLEPLYRKEWISYIGSPKSSPENIIDYIGRYAFKIAVSNERIKDISNGIITFRYKDSKDNSKTKIMKLDAMEFIRRFLMHVLPHRFTKIKHYGFMANRNKKALIKLCRILIGQKVFSDFTVKLNKSFPKFFCPVCNSENFHFNFYYSSA